MCMCALRAFDTFAQKAGVTHHWWGSLESISLGAPDVIWPDRVRSFIVLCSKTA